MSGADQGAHIGGLATSYLPSDGIPTASEGRHSVETSPTPAVHVPYMGDNADEKHPAEPRAAPPLLEEHMTGRMGVPTSSVAIQGGHFTIRQVRFFYLKGREPSLSLMSSAEGSVVRNTIGRTDQKANPSSSIQGSGMGELAGPELIARAQQISRTKGMEAIVATRVAPPGPVSHHCEEATGLFWSPYTALESISPTPEILELIQVQYDERRYANNDLAKALMAYATADNTRKKVFVLVGDLGLPPALRSWDTKIFVPSDIRSRLASLDKDAFELLSEAKCRNIGKRRILDVVRKRLRKDEDLKHAWFRQTGGMLIEDTEVGRVALASASIEDARGRLHGAGPLMLMLNPQHTCCGLILAGMLEYFHRQNFHRSILFFDRNDDPHIRLKVMDALAAHSILSSFLGKACNLNTWLHWEDDRSEEWWSKDFVESVHLR